LADEGYVPARICESVLRKTLITSTHYYTASDELCAVKMSDSYTTSIQHTTVNTTCLITTYKHN